MAAKKVAKKTVKKAAKKVVKKTAKKTTKKTAKKMTKKTSKKTQKQSAEIIKSGLPQVGEPAPDFTLLDQNGKEVSLKDFRGLNVVVYFYPKAMTPGCTVQACALRDSQEKLKDAEVAVLGISTDPVKKLKQFEEKQGLNFSLLSDEKHEVAEKYGTWGLKKFMGREYMGLMRQSFLIDKKGILRYVMHKVDTKTHHDVVVNFFKHLE